MKVAKGSGPTQVYVPTNIVKANAKKPEDHLIKSVKPSSSGTSATVSTNDPESSNAHEEGIYFLVPICSCVCIL